MNPILERQRAPTASGGAPMQIGETRIVTARDPKTGEVVKEITIVRTAREYVYDLCDAYNRARPNDKIEYFVINGEVKLGLPSHHRRPQGEYKPTDADVARIREYVAEAIKDGVTQEQFNAHVRKTGGCPVR
jgi:hypothetical protein